MYSPRLYKYRDLYVLYIPTVHTFFGSVNFTHTLGTDILDIIGHVTAAPSP